METKITIYKSLVFETVKNETHITAHVARASNKDASEVAFHEEAGDETYHERKLERSFYASLDKFKAEITSFLDENLTSANINTTYANDSDGKVEITLTLNNRYNSAYLGTLADLVSKYVEDSMLVLWWTPINANQAKIYSEHLLSDKASIFACFVKKAPTSSNKSYSDVTGSVVS